VVYSHPHKIPVVGGGGGGGAGGFGGGGGGGEVPLEAGRKCHLGIVSRDAAVWMIL